MSLKLITFDLDNTLWDVGQVIRGAEAMLRAWLRRHVPDAAALYETGQITDEIRSDLLAERPGLVHDLSTLRIEIITRIIHRSGRDEPEASTLASQAFEVFYEGRHRVQFFDHALEVLDELKERYVLAALTNGNADIRRLGLERYFDYAYSSADVGASKPAPDMFEAALRRSQMMPQQALHVGDHLEHDVHGAANVGMHTIWVNLAGEPPSGPTTPTGAVASLSELPAEIERIRRELVR